MTYEKAVSIMSGNFLTEELSQLSKLKQLKRSLQQ